MGTNEGQQDALFDVHGPDYEVGYRVPIACQVAGITYRQLDYWARTDLVKPSIRNASGSGSQRLYSFRDILVLKIVIRKAVSKLENLGVDDLAGLTLVSDGATVYECRSSEEVIDLLNGGQGVFGIAVPGLMKELSGDITSFPSEKISQDPAIDELAERRRRRRLA